MTVASLSLRYNGLTKRSSQNDSDLTLLVLGLDWSGCIFQKIGNGR